MQKWAQLCILIIKRNIFWFLNDLVNTALTVKREYSKFFEKQQEKFCLSLHYKTINSINSDVFANVLEIYKFKAKGSDINEASLCLVNFTKDLSVDSMKKHRLYGHVYDFWVN